MPSFVNFFPFLVFLLWLAVIAYVIHLAARLVAAVEQIAAAMAQRSRESSKF